MKLEQNLKISIKTETQNYNEDTKVYNRHDGNSYKNGVTDLSGSTNAGTQNFDLSAGLMNL